MTFNTFALSNRFDFEGQFRAVSLYYFRTLKREWMGPGGFLGLQNRWGAAFVVPGGFDSLALPPVLGV